MQRSFDPVNRLRSTRIYEIGKRDGIQKVIISIKKKVFARILKILKITSLHFNNTQWTYLYLYQNISINRKNINLKLSSTLFLLFNQKKTIREEKLKDPLPARYSNDKLSITFTQCFPQNLAQCIEGRRAIACTCLAHANSNPNSRNRNKPRWNPDKVAGFECFQSR